MIGLLCLFALLLLIWCSCIIQCNHNSLYLVLNKKSLRNLFITEALHFIARQKASELTNFDLFALFVDKLKIGYT